MQPRMVLRKGYLDRLVQGRDDTNVVKIVTGIRRCGKSTLMMQYMDLLRESGVEDERIIYANMEDRKFENITDFKALNAWLFERISPKDRTYVFLDEIQRVEGWERSVNSLMVDADADIYITGSNAYMLSSDLSTYLSGRYVEINMLPLSFAEFLELNPPTDREDKEVRLSQYIWSGSMPVIEPGRDEQYNADILQGIYNTVVRKDIQSRIGVRDQVTFENVVRFIMSNIGNTTSSASIAKEVNISPVTVRKYLEAMEDAFLIYKVYRFDIRGKRLLKTREKYYVSDTGIRNAALGLAAGNDMSRQLENIVYLELLRRGYRVTIGSYRDREVDFTAIRNGNVEYFQVTQTMLPDHVYEREIRSLLSTGDNYPKTVLSLDKFVRPLEKGLIHKNIIDWLLEQGPSE